MSRLYIRVKTGFYTHRKTVRLKLLIGTDAFWIPPKLWAYCAENQPDGDVSGYSSEELSDLIGCLNHATSIKQALTDCGFIDKSGVVHDWAEHNGYHERFSARARLAAAARWGKKEKTPIPPKVKDSGKGKGERGVSIDQALLGDATSINCEGSHTPFPEAQIPSWEEFWAYCQTQACLLPAEWYALDKWEAANQIQWTKMTNWKAYARRCKTWWESDGRQMKPPVKGNSAESKTSKPGGRF